MAGTWSEIAKLMHRLSWCVIVGFVSVDRNLHPLALPGALVAADALRRLTPLLASRAAQVWMHWAGVASGGVVIAAALGWIPAVRGPASVALFVTISIGISTYACGLAAWTAAFDDGRLARRMHVSVVTWWATLALGVVAFVTGRPVAQGVAPSGTTIGDHAVARWWMAPLLLGCVAAFWLLAGALHVIRTTLHELAAEEADQLASERG